MRILRESSCMPALTCSMIVFSLNLWREGKDTLDLVGSMQWFERYIPFKQAANTSLFNRNGVGFRMNWRLGEICQRLSSIHLFPPRRVFQILRSSTTMKRSWICFVLYSEKVEGRSRPYQTKRSSPSHDQKLPRKSPLSVMRDPSSSSTPRISTTETLRAIRSKLIMIMNSFTIPISRIERAWHIFYV